MEHQQLGSKKGEFISGNLPACAFVQKSHLFKGVEPIDVEKLFLVARLVRYRADELIICEGACGDCLYLIMSGTVRVMTNSKDGLVELAQLGRGAFFGEVACLTGRPRTASVQALTEVELIEIERTNMSDIFRKYPKVRKLLQAMMNGRARMAIEKTRG